MPDEATPRGSHGSIEHRLGALAVAIETESLVPGEEWEILEDRHTLIVHLDGRLLRLRTELASYGSSVGEPASGEAWTIPAGRRYRGSSGGGNIRYARLSVPVARDAAGVGWRGLAPLAGIHDRLIHGCAAALSEVLMRCEGGEDALYADQLLSTLVMHVGRRYGDDVHRGRWRSGRALDESALMRVESFVEDQIEHSFRLLDLAEVAGVPLRVFAAAFRLRTGVTPWQYVIQRRLARARELMGDKSLDLTTIALRCGFASHAHFTRCARKQWGVPPSHARISRV